MFWRTSDANTWIYICFVLLTRAFSFVFRWVGDSTFNSNSNNHTPSNNEPTTSYTKLNEDGSRLAVNASNSYNNSTVGGSRSVHSLRRSHILSGREETGTEDPGNAAQLLEIPEEIYRVRRSALQVLKPLIRTWVSIYFWPSLPPYAFRWSASIFIDWTLCHHIID